MFITAMIGLATAAGLAWAGGRAPSPAPAGIMDEGTFVISLGGKQVGAEKFSIRSTEDNKVDAQAQIELHVEQAGKTYDFRTSPKLVMGAELEPETYAWTQKGAQSSRLEVDFRTSPARARYHTVEGDDDVRDFNLPKGLIVLDDNVVHHYQLLVYQFDRVASKKQTFPAFIPQEALPGILNVEDLGTEQIEVADTQRELQHILVSSELARIDLWVDKDRRLQRVLIPAAQLEAVRKK